MIYLITNILIMENSMQNYLELLDVVISYLIILLIIIRSIVMLGL